MYDITAYSRQNSSELDNLEEIKDNFLSTWGLIKKIKLIFCLVSYFSLLGIWGWMEGTRRENLGKRGDNSPRFEFDFYANLNDDET